MGEGHRRAVSCTVSCMASRVPGGEGDELEVERGGSTKLAATLRQPRKLRWLG